MKFTYKILAAALAISVASYGFAQSSSLTRATELRADKMGSASVMSELPIGLAVQIISLEGG